MGMPEWKRRHEERGRGMLVFLLAIGSVWVGFWVLAAYVIGHFVLKFW